MGRRTEHRAPEEQTLSISNETAGGKTNFMDISENLA